MRRFRINYFLAISILVLQRIFLTIISKGNFEIQFVGRNTAPRTPVVEYSTSLKISDVFELFSESTIGESIECMGGKRIVQDKGEIQARKIDKQSKRRIPRIIHQTSKDRCLVDGFYDATQKWRNLSGYEYVFYDDNAMEKLFQMNFPEFPHLRMVTENCILSGTARADLFRYLILYVAGGLYADIDTAPHSLNAETIQTDYDGFFVVEQYHLLSQVGSLDWEFLHQRSFEYAHLSSICDLSTVLGRDVIVFYGAVTPSSSHVLRCATKSYQFARTNRYRPTECCFRNGTTCIARSISGISQRCGDYGRPRKARL